MKTSHHIPFALKTSTVSLLFLLFLSVLYIAHLHLPYPISHSPTLTREVQALPHPKHGPISFLPSRPEHNLCWILTCSDRVLPNSQAFHLPAYFRHIHLGMPTYIRNLNLHPAWCRVGHLRTALKSGQHCALYVDDDVFLNLTQLHHEIQSAKRGSVLVTASKKHGMEKHINAGFVVFTNLQNRISTYVVETWYAARWQPGNVPKGYLRDQTALNRIVGCDYPGVVCYRKEEEQTEELGLMGHCFSYMDKVEPGEKARCMSSFKELVGPWDREGRS